MKKILVVTGMIIGLTVATALAQMGGRTCGQQPQQSGGMRSAHDESGGDARHVRRDEADERYDAEDGAYHGLQDGNRPRHDAGHGQDDA